MNFKAFDKSWAQPDGGEGRSVMATGFPVTGLWEEAVLLSQDNAKVRGDGQKSSIRRAYRDEPAQQGKVLYTLRVYAV